MEDSNWKRDDTPYYIFPCAKCKNYLYVKISQKGKKCLRCGKFHRVMELEPVSEVVKGISAAKDRLIVLQDELARKELGNAPDFHAESEFILVTDKKSSKDSPSMNQETNDFDAFKSILLELDQKFNEFPGYLIRMMSEEKQIPRIKCENLIKKFLLSKFLIKSARGYYHISRKLLSVGE